VVARSGEELVRMRVRLACLGASGRPSRLPDRVRDALRPLVSDTK
jgi:acyl-CoA thioesterase FadM